ncbi:3'(2'),5'-bisphosphate nucleotidase CysQ [Aggregatimonas sangjinii]|uniref:3'(2'),5'-bisphosphate nucleotidase CysQ n=1 Tax=Aggregatimonas sangjinii TaxID=2583587 RepID=A0A5B7SP44_9FLAO|nr:3'(2'),5'-bisphosphate nucleotidase CysQ [Aggregatimonas sangjinii]QCW98790.1 3'(2'),5'-bisphosphate nucleotidase CysQ [Aggregatimonas sangjinii]
MKRIYQTAIQAAIEGGKAILKVYNQDEIHVDYKKDDSPLTVADSAANAKIVGILNETDLPIISEESKQLAYSTRKEWTSCWIVDPLDGTKEFIKRNGEFTVNIALCNHGIPVFGVIYVPVTRELYYAVVDEKKAFKTVLDLEHVVTNKLNDEIDRIYPNSNKSLSIRVVASRSHMNDDTIYFTEELKQEFPEVEIVSKGSSLKFCLVAEGKADVYPRFAPTMEWDTAAGHAICSAVGVKVISQHTQKEVTYNKENLLNPYFLVSNQ